MLVIKRDGSKEQFDLEKVKLAVSKAFESTGSKINDVVFDRLEKYFNQKLDQNQEETDVDKIHNLVEQFLMKYNYYDVSREYILNRYQKALERAEDKRLIKEISEKLGAINVANQNANLDEKSFGGRVGEASRCVTKDFALKYCMSKKSRQNHLNNEIYTHDLDSYSIGMHNCTKGNSWIKIQHDGEVRTIKVEDFKKELPLEPGKLVDVSNAGYSILSRDGWTKLINITCRYLNKDELIYKIKTRTGLPLELTGEHRLPIIRDGKEQVLGVKDIQVGDELLEASEVRLSANDLNSEFLDLTQLQDDELDLRITNLTPLRHYLTYKYGIRLSEYFKEKGFDSSSNALTIKLSQFKQLEKDYPLTFEVLSSLRIKSSGSYATFPLFIPYSAHLAKLYAYIYADGGVYVNKKASTYQLTFTNKNEKLVDDFIDSFENVFGVKLGKQKPSSWDKTNNLVYRTTFGSRLIVKLFKDFAGARKYGSADMSIPDFVINGNSEIKYAYLSAATDTDGCLGNSGINYTSCCPRYCEQLKLILGGLGYHATVVKEASKGSTYRFGAKTGIRNFDTYTLKVARNDEVYNLYTRLNTFKRNNQYSYKGLTDKLNECKIISIEKINEPDNTEVYDLETGDHWYIINDFVSHNCLSIPFDDLLSKGFNTRQVDIRPARSINTAFQLVAVIFQIQSLQQFGGVSATHLDWTMVPYVRRSFFKHYLLQYLKQSEEFDKIDVLTMSNEDLDDWIDENKENYLKKWNLKFEDFTLENEDTLDPQIRKSAIFDTRIELYQAVEGMYHNLNSLQSRSGK